MQEKEKRLGDDNRSIGSASDSGHGNSDDEANRSPHPSGRLCTIKLKLILKVPHSLHRLKVTVAS